MRKGFTLIELLAVIVILAIIAVIAVPIVLGIIDNAKESSVLRSADFYVGALQNEIALENTKSGGTLNPKKCTISGDTAECSGVTLKVKVDGEAPVSGIVTFDEGRISRVSLNFLNGSVMTGANGTLVFKKETLEEITEKKYEEYQEKVKAGEDVQGKTAFEWIKEELTNEGLYSDDIVVYEDGRVIVGVSKIAGRLFEAGVPIGATVAGYDISGNVKSYTTDGKEFTTPETDTEVIDKPNPQTVNVSTDVSWSYMGIGADGEALIVFDLNNTSVIDKDARGVYSAMALGGLGGWFNGVNTLNNVCDVLYSTSKGKARSINYEDVLHGIDWVGPISEYTNDAGTKVYLDDIKTIGELMAMGNDLKGEKKRKNGTPEYPLNYTKKSEADNSTNFDSYKVDFLNPIIRNDSNGDGIADDGLKTNGTLDGRYVNAPQAVVDVVLGTLDINYWLADTSTGVSFSDSSDGKYEKAQYYIRRANCKNISGYSMLTSNRTTRLISGSTDVLRAELKYGGAEEDKVTGKVEENGKVVLRPVVELFDTVEFTYDKNNNTLNLN